MHCPSPRTPQRQAWHRRTEPIQPPCWERQRQPPQATIRQRVAIGCAARDPWTIRACRLWPQLWCAAWRRLWSGGGGLVFGRGTQDATWPVLLPFLLPNSLARDGTRRHGHLVGSVI